MDESPEILKKHQETDGKDWKEDFKQYCRLKAKFEKQPQCFTQMGDKASQPTALLDCLDCQDYQQCWELSLIRLVAQVARQDDD